ncbi:DUF3120 domain-containing protein [Synechococcus sp. M16CYN]
MIVLPVFLQAPWVRIHPFSATLFTAVLIAAGITLNRSENQHSTDLGSLLVGFSGSWFAGCVFWGWLRAHPILHLPVEAFALPIALAGLGNRWHLASAFYLSSLLGTAFTDLMIAITGVMRFWPTVVTASPNTAPQLLHKAGLHLLHPLQLIALAAAIAIILWIARELSKLEIAPRCSTDTLSMSASVLTTTLWVDGLFLLFALLQPSLSGLIE